ncbi:MAG: haloacid dehalogenase type II [Rhizobiaceae bacterium]
MTGVRALIFDVFGTLVDWRCGVSGEAARFFARKGITIDPDTFADAWRGEYQPAMERIRDGGRGYVPLDILHRENLDIILARFALDEHFSEAERSELNRAWEKLPPWPDTVAGLDALRERFFIAPCSNGSIALMVRLARFAHLPWDTILGADIARDYKPKPETYLASAAALGLEPGQVMMVAAHNSDLEAARACGLKTAFFPRRTEHGPGQSSDMQPTHDWDVICEDLENLAEILMT